MPAYLIDTDVLIDHLRSRTAALEFLEARALQRDVLYYSTITRAEIRAGMRPGEEDRVDGLLRALVAVAVDEVVADFGGEYRQQFPSSHRLELPDALIAATAKHLGATLVTTNIRHYPMSDIGVLRPY